MSCGCSEAPCSSLASRRFSFLCTGGVRPRRNLRRRLRRFEFWEAVMSSSAKTIVRAYQNYINGQWVKSSSGETFPVYDPSTEEVIAQVASGTAADVDNAVKAARAAFDSGPWRQTSAADRGRLLYKLAEKIRANAAPLAELECRNSGKPSVEAESDIANGSSCLQYYAAL